MLNIGPLELMVILLVALLVVAPQRLPEVGRSAAKVLRELRRQTDEVRSSFEATINPDFDDPDELDQPEVPGEATDALPTPAPVEIPAREGAEDPEPSQRTGPAALRAGTSGTDETPGAGDRAAGGAG